MDVMRLVLVDDYRMVTEALASRLSSAPDLWVAGSCQTDDPRLPEIVRWLRPDMVLIDVEPLGIAIAEVLGRIRAAWPPGHIIVVTADEDASHAVDAARAGAEAWVSKSQGADQLESVLRGVARGHSWFPPNMLGEVLRALRDDVRAARESSNLLDTLSPRELDVLTSMAKGKRARQIAAELMISADTVRTHTRSIFGKLEVHSRIEAVSVAWAAGLRPEESESSSDDPPRKVPPQTSGRDGRPGVSGRDGGPGASAREGRPGVSGRDGGPGASAREGRPGVSGRDGGPGASARERQPLVSGRESGPVASGREGGPVASGRPPGGRTAGGRAPGSRTAGAGGAGGAPAAKGVAGANGAAGANSVAAAGGAGPGSGTS